MMKEKKYLFVMGSAEPVDEYLTPCCHHDSFKMKVLAAAEYHRACSLDCKMRGYTVLVAASDFRFGRVGSAASAAASDFAVIFCAVS